MEGRNRYCPEVHTLANSWEEVYLMYFFTADEHYNHKNIIKYCKGVNNGNKRNPQKYRI